MRTDDCGGGLAGRGGGLAGRGGRVGGSWKTPTLSMDDEGVEGSLK